MCFPLSENHHGINRLTSEYAALSFHRLKSDHGDFITLEKVEGAHPRSGPHAEKGVEG